MKWWCVQIEAGSFRLSITHKGFFFYTTPLMWSFGAI